MVDVHIMVQEVVFVNGKLLYLLLWVYSSHHSRDQSLLLHRFFFLSFLAHRIVFIFISLPKFGYEN